MQVNKVLVPLDGSMLGEAALTWAASATRQGGTVVLVRAADDLTTTNARAAETYLAGVAPHVKELGVSNVDTSVWYGPAVETIVEAARHGNADLIVMSTHGRRGLRRLVMGSVAESVVRSTTKPVLLVRLPRKAVSTPLPAVLATAGGAVR